MNEHKKLILDLLNESKGDDLYRAERAFRYYTVEQMISKYGDSDVTPIQIIEEYKAQRIRIEKAIAWLNSIT